MRFSEVDGFVDGHYGLTVLETVMLGVSNVVSFELAFSCSFPL